MKTTKKILLEEIDKDLPFSIPENYFNQFANQMDKQIGYVSSHQRFLKPWMYMAAMFVGIFILSGVFYNTHQRNLARNSENYDSYVMAQVDEAAVLDYYVSEPIK